MAQPSISWNATRPTHIYVRDINGFLRPCWATKGVIYCGGCVKGTIQPAVGAVCPICTSTVERILEAAPAGKFRDCRMHMKRLLSNMECVIYAA